jgi:hypothetical protein
MIFIRKVPREKHPRGQRNPLKRLNSAKENKVNSFDFFCWSLAGFGEIRQNLGLALKN